MADNGIKISGLTEATSAADADVVSGVQSGTTKKFPLSVLFNYIKGKLTASDIGAQASITASGILKGDGSGGVSAAVAGTDYATPAAVTVKADKTDLTSISQTSPTATVSIASGNFFYLDGVLVQAKTAISNGDTFTSGTNYETPSAGSLNALKSAIDSSDANVGIVETGDNATRNITSGQYVIWKGSLYKANQAISSGASLSGKLTVVSGGGLNDMKSVVITSTKLFDQDVGATGSYGLLSQNYILKNYQMLVLEVSGNVYNTRTIIAGHGETITCNIDATASIYIHIQLKLNATTDKIDVSSFQSGTWPNARVKLWGLTFPA